VNPRAGRKEMTKKICIGCDKACEEGLCGECERKLRVLVKAVKDAGGRFQLVFEGKEMSGEIKPEMWENTLSFLKQITSEAVKDVSWKWRNSGVEKITITFEHPIYTTDRAGNEKEAKKESKKK
jgi:hypothetical protein